VKLLDEREGPVAGQELHRAFNRQTVVGRIAILLAGPLMNFFFAVIAFWAMYVAGVPGLSPVVGSVQPESVAAVSGMRSDDRIVAVGGRPVATWEGTVLELLDGLLSEGRITIEAMSAASTSRLLYLDVRDRVSELTEPGALLTGLGIAPWAPRLPPLLGEIVRGGSAETAGLQAGDLLLAADNVPIQSWSEWVDFVQKSPGQEVTVGFQRGDEVLTVPLAIATVESEDGARTGRIGAAVRVDADPYQGFRAEQRYGSRDALVRAIERTWSMSDLTVRMVARMVTGEVSVKNISGPINIAQYAGYSASVGLASFLSFLGIVSLSLGILNLLPIPVLDGGQIVYQLAEACKGSPLSDRAQILGQQIGIAFLVLIMSFAFYNDLTRVFS